MKNILFIASSLSYGGAEKMLSFVANGFAERDYRVTILNLQEKVDQQQEILPCIKVVRIRQVHIRYLARLIQVISLIRASRVERPDVIIAFKFTPNYLATLIGKILRVPVIVSERADPSHENYREGRARYYWKLINSADGGVFQTSMAKQCYEQHLAEVGTVIPNPVIVDFEKVNSLKNNYSIVSIGRIDNEQKRYDVMLEAFSIFHSKYPMYQLKIYGTGDDVEMIKKMIVTMSLCECVSLEGYTSSPENVLAENSIFLITSDYEGISNALLEAMAVGIPVISTDSTPGGAAMLIKDRVNGLIVPRGNPEKIAEGLCLYASDDKLRQECGRNGRDVLDLFSPPIIMDMWVQYVNEIIKKTNNT